MKVVILAGGLGTRLSENTDVIPKPLIEIGGRPILWHIMKLYSHYGFNDFIILTGYMSHKIKEYFLDYYARYSDITIDMATNSVQLLNHRNENWKVSMLYTGLDSETGTRLAEVKDYIEKESFMLTYGDGIGNVNIPELLEAHKQSKNIATVTAIPMKEQFGVLNINGKGQVENIQEKPQNQKWINGGFFAMESAVFDYIKDGDSLEKNVLPRIVEKGVLGAFKHSGFWHSMDTLKDKNELTEMWMTGRAPWAIWQ